MSKITIEGLPGTHMATLSIKELKTEK